MDPLIERLSIELADRQLSNPSYSIRAFARDLNVNLTSLSTILARKRKPSKKLRAEIAKSLLLSPSYAQSDSHLLNPANRTSEDDEFHFIAEWHHLAILNLLREGLPPRTISDLCERLALSKPITTVAVERLIRLGYVEETKGKFRRVVRPIKTSEDLPSSAIRKLHTGVLEKAKEALHQVSVAEREFSTTFLMLRAPNLAKAKELVRQMRTNLIDICDPGSKASKDSKLFAFAIQLFPLEERK